MSALVLLLALAVALLGVLVAGLLRSHAEILRALHELGVNPAEDRAPRVPGERSADATAVDVVGTDPDGNAVHIAVGGAPQRTLLSFLTTSCLTCRTFWNDFADPKLDVPANARLVIVTKDPDEEQEAAIVELAPELVPTVRSSATWSAYGVTVAPYFLLVDPALGVIGEGAATTWPHVRDLLAQAVADRHSRARTVEAEQ
jgi:hypothetical protein